MNSFSDFLNNLNVWGLADLVISALAALFCITFHELSHGYVAYRMGDPTAKLAGRLTLNPIKHIDPFGLVMMMVAHVGWAKPVPVDARYFRNPKKGMAITALAGPVSNFLLAVLTMGLASLLVCLWELLPVPDSVLLSIVTLVLLSFLSNVAILSVGLGLFNLIPISPLDGSKVLFAFLPDRAYMTILRYERFVMLLVVGLTMAGVFSTPLSWLIQHVLTLLCKVTGYEESMLYFTANLFRYLMA